MQYYYAYILQLKRRPSLPMSVGSGGHQALEYNGRHKINLGKDLPVNDLLDVASTFIDQHTEELEPGDLKGASKGEAKDKALGAIKVFRIRDAPKIIPAGVEVEFNLDINEPNQEPVRIVNGKIDLITTDYNVFDYKFTGRAKSQGEVDTSPQLTLYSKVVKALTGQYPKNVGLIQFLSGSSKTPPDSRGILRDNRMMTPEAQERRFARIAHQFRMAEKSIRLGIFSPADDSQTCAWCGYRDQCQSSLVNEYEAIVIRGEA